MDKLPDVLQKMIKDYTLAMDFREIHRELCNIYQYCEDFDEHSKCDRGLFQHKQPEDVLAFVCARHYINEEYNREIFPLPHLEKLIWKHPNSITGHINYVY